MSSLMKMKTSIICTNSWYLILIVLLLSTSCAKQSSVPSISPPPPPPTTTTVTFPTNFHPSLNSTNATWNPTTQTVTITKNVIFPTNEEDITTFHWHVPTTVAKIVIQANVTVTGGFKAAGNLIIEGDNPENSILFGTTIKEWAHGPDMKKGTADDRLPEGNKPDHGAINEDKGASGITITVRNLKIENSRLYAITARNSNKVMVENVYILNSRASGSSDYKSNSDGIVGGVGSRINNCYIDTWDDSIKFYYNNMEVSNTTIIHNKNGAPFQLGWGDKDAVRCTIRNVKIKNTIGQSSTNQALFSFAGSSLSPAAGCAATLVIDGLVAQSYDAKAKLKSTNMLPLVYLNGSSCQLTLIVATESNGNLTMSAPVAYVGTAPAPTTVGSCTTPTDNQPINNVYACGSDSATGCSWKE